MQKAPMHTEHWSQTQKPPRRWKVDEILKWETVTGVSLSDGLERLSERSDLGQDLFLRADRLGDVEKSRS